MRRINYSRRAVETRRYTYNIISYNNILWSCGAVRGVSVQRTIFVSSRPDEATTAFEQRGGRVFMQARACIPAAAVENAGVVRDPDDQRALMLAQARYASAHRCHNDFITNQGALGGDYRVGGGGRIRGGRGAELRLGTDGWRRRCFYHYIHSFFTLPAGLCSPISLSLPRPHTHTHTHQTSSLALAFVCPQLRCVCVHTHA